MRLAGLYTAAPLGDSGLLVGQQYNGVVCGGGGGCDGSGVCGGSGVWCVVVFGSVSGGGEWWCVVVVVCGGGVVW